LRLPAGQLDEAHDAICKAIEAAGGGEDGQQWYVPELLRIKGEVLLRQSSNQAVQAAEACITQATDMAREQGALFWELRAALSAARLHVGQKSSRCLTSASTGLRPIYRGLRHVRSEGGEASARPQCPDETVRKEKPTGSVQHETCDTTAILSVVTAKLRLCRPTLTLRRSPKGLGAEGPAGHAERPLFSVNGPSQDGTVMTQMRRKRPLTDRT
jgi:hypothetical protein